MTTGRRISITVYSALALGIDALGVSLGGGIADPDAWLIALLVLTGLAVVGVFFVNRWWALFPAPTTIAALWLGASMGSGSYRAIPSEYIGPFFVAPVLIGAAVLSIGLVARKIWDLSGPPEADDAEAVGR